jgi:hypothetical protein
MRSTRQIALASTVLTSPARAGAIDHQDGNLTGLFIAEEETLGVLPDAPVWYEREPNSYSDFGGAFAMTTRKPITHDRQHGKGDVSDNNPTAGFQEDLTPLNMRRPMQAFLYADAREKPSTQPLNGVAAPITAVDGVGEQYEAAAGLDRFLVGHLVQPFGFADAENNAFNRVTVVAAGALTVAAGVVADAAPAATAGLEAVGFQFPAGDVALTMPAGRVLLSSTAGGVLDLDLNLGEWIGVGGDNAATRFATNAPFYGRISGYTDTTIEFDKTTGVQLADAGAGQTLQIFFGTVIRNEDDCTLIKGRSYTLERQYGCGADAESDGVRGWSPNQITVTIPTPGADAKITVELTGIATSSFERLGAGDAEPVLTADAAAVVRGALNEPCFKPGLDVYQHKLAVIDELTLNPAPLVAFNSEGTLVINNNLGGNKAIETFGNASVNVGEFAVTGSLNSYWTSVEATRRVRQGADLTWHLILTKRNSAVIFDIASLGLGNARATVEANTPVKLPLDTAAGKGKFGYTLLTTFLRYVPAALVAQAQI